MKKIYLSILLVVAVYATKAQVEIGVQFSPCLSTTRIESKTQAFDFDSYKSGIRFNTGLVADIFLRDNIAISTGLWYSVKRSGITVKDSITTTNSVSNTQYLNLPIGLKLYTQEIMANMRLFLQVGGVADFKISKDKIKQNAKELINPNSFSKPFNSSVNVSIGTEIKIGSHNKVFGSIFYNRGLINMLKKDYATSLNSQNVSLNSDQMGLTFGYKF